MCGTKSGICVCVVVPVANGLPFNDHIPRKTLNVSHRLTHILDIFRELTETKRRDASITWTKKAPSRASARLSWPLSRASCCAELSCPLSMPASSSSLSCFLRQSRQQEVRALLAISSQRHFTFCRSSSVARRRRLPRYLIVSGKINMCCFVALTLNWRFSRKQTYNLQLSNHDYYGYYDYYFNNNYWASGPL